MTVGPAAATTLLLTALILSSDPSAAVAYEAVEIDDAGTIAGTVTFDGRSRSRSMAIAGPASCGSRVDIPVIEVGEHGGLKNAVVYIEFIERGAAVDRTVKIRLDHRRCRFEPRVQSLSIGQVLQVTNSDPFLHKVRAQVGGKTAFSIALPLRRMKIDKRLTRPGLLYLESAAGYEWMSAWVFVFSHPYHSLTDDRGRFEIARIPPGSYRLAVWHEELGTRTIEVEVKADETATVQLAVEETP